MICVGRQQKFLLLFIVLVITCAASADIRLPSVIGDNMVLQRGMELPIWGLADPCEQIVITYVLSSTTWHATADANGKWQTKIGPFNAHRVGLDLSFKGNNTIVLKNVVVGEVWVCSGQSNMNWPVSHSVNSRQEVNDADYPQIRLFTVGQKVSQTPMKYCQGRWKECNLLTAAPFSAVGYFFGRDLYKQLNVPIGLIHASWGGTPAESWMSREYLEKDADFMLILKRFEETCANYPQLLKQYQSEKKQYEETASKLKAEGKPIPPRPDFKEPIGQTHPYSPTGLFNGMIKPIIPYGIRGVIWYQGETNAGRAYQYRKLFPAMIKNWRDAWGEGDFPFLFVQLANWKEVNSEPTDNDWAELREAQLMTLSVPKTGMAVTIDIGEVNSIHPINKQDVSKRLALWAIAKTYGKNVVYSGPLYKLMEIQGNSAILHFDHVGAGLIAKDEPLKGFAIAGADNKFVWADAKIEGDTVVVSSEKVTEPVAVRYGWSINPVCNLYNKDGLPASPFRTDTWPGITDNRR